MVRSWPSRRSIRASLEVGLLLLLLVGTGSLFARPEPEASSSLLCRSHHEPSLAPVPLDPATLSTESVLSAFLPELAEEERRELVAAIVEESEQAGFDPFLILGLMSVESDFREESRSSMGARGLMQLMPSTARYLAEREGLALSAEEIFADRGLQVRLGVRYLAHLKKRFRGLDLALMAYNAGPEKLRSVLSEPEDEESVARYRGYAKAVKRRWARLKRDYEVTEESLRASVP